MMRSQDKKSSHLSTTFRSFIMINKIVLVAGLFLANVAFAANQDNTAVISDKDNAVMIATAKDTWSMVAMNANQGLTKVREFHEMGDSGVQQIDYVVNCSNQTLALAAFVVITSTGSKPARSVEPTIAELSFYKPVISHDTNITANACENRVAMNGSTNSN
jgi:hypothetical protein